MSRILLLLYILLGNGVGMLLFLGRALCSRASTSKSALIRRSDADSCRMIIAGKNPFQNTATGILTSLQSRAGPNQALRKAFGINNAFTSEDNNVVKDFVAKARTRMNLYIADWERAATLAATTLKSLGFLEQVGRDCDGATSRTVPVANVVQVTCLTVVLSTILQADIDKFQYKDILDLAEGINRIWVSSKNMKEELRPVYQKEVALHNILRAIFPGIQVDDSTQNPLNLILPSFETLWRIVLRTFLEVISSRKPEFKQALEAFFRSPGKEQFNHQISPGISARNIISEALRLYPPTRRVYRHVRNPGTDKPILYAADIEACHRNAIVWGPDALNFYPGRWESLNNSQKASFMPFGAEPFLCPAKPVFGPRMIALLVGALLCNYADGWELHGRFGKRDINMITEGVYLDRNSCGELYLMRQIEE
ncbi:hypothetical protein McanCB56680_005958 [Microsporum canis]|uniref:Cytochrome P450 n=1 Tax=Arthroderma otae (strain ATCC MYA-4605 / CBS 113480) TaxID=554155 RepID=C5FBV3_ARTOC|nr:conserved hypothetical protein [Microsporum canis CBS 113480]EEQ27287.1 conserved hypothetical protein [Microsporum canis CBS 113480]